jgi:hypothetical protein
MQLLIQRTTHRSAAPAAVAAASIASATCFHAAIEDTKLVLARFTKCYRMGSKACVHAAYMQPRASTRVPRNSTQAPQRYAMVLEPLGLTVWHMPLAAERGGSGSRRAEEGAAGGPEGGCRQVLLQGHGQGVSVVAWQQGLRSEQHGLVPAAGATSSCCLSTSQDAARRNSYPG